MADWFCNIAGKISGPMTAERLKGLADAGQVTPHDLVGQSTEGPWVPARRVKGLFPAAGAGATTAASPAPEPHQAGPPPEPPIPKPPVATPVPPPPDDSVEPPDANGPFAIVTGETSPTARFTARKARKQKAPKKKEPRRPPEELSPREKQKRLVLILLLILVVGSVAGGGLVWWRNHAASTVEAPLPAGTAQADAPEPVPGEVDLNSLVPGETTTHGPPPGGSDTDLAADLWIDRPGAEGTVDVPAGGTLKVAILSVEVGRPGLTGPGDRAARPKNHYLLIRLKLHTDEAGRRFPYRSWGSGGGATLRDESGHEYGLKTPVNFHQMRIEGQIDGTATIENDPVHDLLVFEPPRPAAERFRLRLSTSALGAKGELRFEIPRSEIRFAHDFQRASQTAERERRDAVHVDDDEPIRIPGLTNGVDDKQQPAPSPR